MKENLQAGRHRLPYPDCPQDEDLESYLLSSYYGLAQDQRIADHIAHCSICQDKIEQMRAFYDILSTELNHPVPPEVIALKNKIQVH